MSSEADLARPVVSWLEAQGLDVYQEVIVPGGRADIVAVCEGLVWIIEVKNSMSLTLMEQAYARLGFAHHVSICVPWRKRLRAARGFVRKTLSGNGIGLITVAKSRNTQEMPESGEAQELWLRDELCRVKELVKPALHRRANTSWVSDLVDEQKVWLPAGSKGGGFWTPFAGTCDKIRQYIRRNPGCTLQQFLDSTTTHYASVSGAKRALSIHLRNGVIRGVTCSQTPSGLELRLNEREDDES